MPRAKDVTNAHAEPRYGEFEALLSSLKADACVIGLFREEHVLAAHPWVVMHRMRAGDLSQEAIYDLLFGGDFPGFQTIFADRLLKRNAFLRGAILKRSTGEAAFEPGVSNRLLEALYLTMETDRAMAMLQESPLTLALERRTSAQVGVVILDSELRIRQQWPRNGFAGSLPLYIEEPLRRSTMQWRQTGVASEPVIFSPVPHIIVRAYPMQRDGYVDTMLTVENVQVRVALARARNEHRLTQRESEVLRYLFEGYRVDEIAQALSVAEATVQDHIKRAISKAGVRNRVQLVARILGWDFATSRE
jgi:DNA-binding CsgD family transcriptional regulator